MSENAGGRNTSTIFLVIGVVSLMAVLACIGVMIALLPTLQTTSESSPPTIEQATEVVVVSTPTPRPPTGPSVVDIIATRSVPGVPDNPVASGPRFSSVRLPEGFACFPRKTCEDMNSCSEAVAYVNLCGMGNLDPDSNGIACEDLCGVGE